MNKLLVARKSLPRLTIAEMILVDKIWQLPKGWTSESL